MSTRPQHGRAPADTHSKCSKDLDGQSWPSIRMERGVTPDLRTGAASPRSRCRRSSRVWCLLRLRWSAWAARMSDSIATTCMNARVLASVSATKLHAKLCSGGRLWSTDALSRQQLPAPLANQRRELPLISATWSAAAAARRRPQRADHLAPPRPRHLPPPLLASHQVAARSAGLLSAREPLGVAVSPKPSCLRPVAGRRVPSRSCSVLVPSSLLCRHPPPADHARHERVTRHRNKCLLYIPPTSTGRLFSALALRRLQR